MAFHKIVLRPGINQQASQTLNEGGWYSCNYVRWRDGLPQKMGGWQLFGSPYPLSFENSSYYNNYPRAMAAWTSLGGQLEVAVGTNTALFVSSNAGGMSLIMPKRTQSTLTNPFTAAGAPPTTATVAYTAHGCNAGDWINVASSTGIVPNGDWQVSSIVDANHFTIVGAGTLTAGTGGGTPVVTLCQHGGAADTVTSGASRVLNAQWTFANWGASLLSCWRNGFLSFWNPDTAFALSSIVTNGTPANGPPLTNSGVLVGMPERHAILYGCSDLNGSTNFDPLLVRWSDVEDYTTWNATATNTAGSFRLQGGSRIIGAQTTLQQILLWTDTSMWSMRFTGDQYVYRFDQIGQGCGLIGPHAATSVNGVAYWMSEGGFYRYAGGAPEQLRCDVWSTVFGSLTFDQNDKVYCGTNAAFNEIWWLYPTITNECTHYVVYNYKEDIWYNGVFKTGSGNVGRSCWVDNCPIINAPLAVDWGWTAVFQQETGTFDGLTVDEMAWWLESGYFDLSNGDEYIYVDRMIPDFGQSMAGAVDVLFKTTNYPTDAAISTPIMTVQAGTEYLTFRARGRQASVRFQAHFGRTDTDWRLYATRVNSQPDGER